jgi:hypothetical protein
MFLSKGERDYLLSVDRQNSNHDYVCVKSRLNKKLKVFVDQELPLLLSKGYLTDIADFRNIAENCKTQWDSLVNDIDLTLHEIENKRYGPKGIRTLDPRHVKAVS